MYSYHQILFLVFFFLAISTAAVPQDSLKLSPSTTEKLDHPYGTIVTLQVEIVDGDLLKDLLHSGFFLFRIKAINDTILTHPILMEFRDRTFLDSAHLPNDIIQLYDYMYGIDSSLSARSSQNTLLLKSKYVGREFTVVGYESGGFTGSPLGIWKYQIVTNVPFHFKHFFIIIAKLSGSNDWLNMKGSLKK